jgi:hypothetical protein
MVTLGLIWIPGIAIQSVTVRFYVTIFFTVVTFPRREPDIVLGFLYLSECRDMLSDIVGSYFLSKGINLVTGIFPCFFKYL